MTAENLLELIGTAKESYVDGAMKTRAEKQRRKSLTLSRALLIAAWIAMMLLLVGCTIAYVLHLQDLKIAEASYIAPKHLDEEGNRVNETEIVRDVLSLQGIAGSPQFLAGKEWYEFEEAYDLDNAILLQADEQGYAAPDDYDAYFVYSQEMVNKVDEIAQQYGLQLAGQEVLTEAPINHVFFEALGLERLHREDALGEVEYQHGYFYACGNFYMEFSLTLDGGTKLLGGVTYCGKDYFHPRYTQIMDPESCVQWTCQGLDGQSLLVVQEQTSAQVFCQREDGFLSAHFRSSTYGQDGELATLSREEIQEAVEVFDYSVKPRKPEIEWASKEVEAYYAKLLAEQEDNQENRINPFELESYREYIDYVIGKMKDPQSFRYGQDPADIYYHLLDINGDGVQELMLGTNPESFHEILTLREGKITLLFNNGMGEHFLCENQVMGFHGISDQGNQSVYYYQMEEGTFRELVNLEYDPERGSWLQQTYDEWGYMEPISEDEARSVMEDYRKIALSGKPLMDYPQ